MAIHLGIRVLDIISKVTISPDLKTTLYVQEEPLYHYICKIEFNQPCCWLYSVPNLLVF